MDLIERILHVSPDHGSGLLESALLLVILVVPIAIATFRIFRRRHVVDGF